MQRRYLRKIKGIDYIGSKPINKTLAMRVAPKLRGLGRNVRIIPTASGTRLYVSPQVRSYNFERIPWRQFEGSVGTQNVDSVALNDYLKTLPGYNPALSWRENLRNIGGDEAIRTLDTLNNPVNEYVERKREVEANNLFAGMLDDILGTSELGIESGFDATTALAVREQQTDDGFDFDFLEVKDPVTGNQIMKPSQDVDIFDLFGLDDGETVQNDDAFLTELDDWFAREFNETGLLPENINKTAQETKRVVNSLALVEDTQKDGQSLDEALMNILDSSFDEMLRTQMDDGEGKLNFAGREYEPTDVFSQSTINPALGGSQPELPAGSQAGYWTYRTAGNLGTVTNNENLFQTKSAFITIDSLGSVVGAEFYDVGSQGSELAAMRQATNQAILLSDSFEQYSSNEYAKYGRVAPGIAIIDGEITIDSLGNWAGWEVSGRTQDYRLEAGDFELYVDGKQLPQGSIPASILRNWILPQTNLNPTSDSRERAEFIGVDFAGADEQNRVALAELARKSGASASIINEIINNYKYKIYDNDTGEALTTHLPDWDATLRASRDLEKSGRNLSITRGKANQRGTVPVRSEVPYVEARYLEETQGFVLRYLFEGV
tara:strand:+ start:1491 stop:3308 length:1818 start_codon:yes stop_codon:yes gene_type:complete